MAADVLLSIGISTDEAKRGHDQIIAYNNDIAASFGKVTAAQDAYSAQASQTEQKKTETVTRAAKERVSVEDRAAASVMQGYLRQSQATDKAGMSAGQYANNMRNLGYQINDVISGLAMGQSPMMILTQQGGQFVQVAQDMGIGLGRVALGVGAVAAVGTALIGPTVHLANMRQEAKELDIALKAVGNSAALSGQKIQALAYQTAAGGMSSRGDVTASFKSISTSSVGRDLGAKQIQDLTKAAEGYAFVTGKTLPEATNDLTKVLAGGYVEMTKLAQIYPMATAQELDQLRVMAQHGDRAAMLAKSIELLNGKFGTLAKEGSGELKTAMHSLTTAWDEMIDKISKGQAYKDFLTMLSQSSRGISTILREGFGSSSGYRPKQSDAQAVADFDAYRKKMAMAKTGPDQYGPFLEEDAITAFEKYRGKITSKINQSGINKEKFGPEFGNAEKENIRISAINSQTNAIIEAAQKQASAYNLIGLARERALVSVEYDKKIAEAIQDDAKASQLKAEKAAALIMVNAQAIGQAKESISVTHEEADAQRRLTDAVGEGYDAQMAAERRNAIAAQERTNPYANAGNAADIAIRQKQDATRDLSQAKYINDLVDSTDKQNRLNGSIINGAEAIRLETDAIEVENKAKQSNYSIEEIRQKLNSASLAKQQEDIIKKAISSSATLSIRQSAQETEMVKAKMKELGATSEEVADVYIEAEARKLDATRNWADGATAAIMRYSRSASNYGQMAGQVVTNSFTSMENALVGFSSGTKKASDAFGEMATSIIQDLIRMQVRASITGPLSDMLSGIVKNISGSGGGGNGAEGYSGEYGGGSYEAVTGQIPGHASGTDSAKRGLAIVGENGPELMQMGGGERIYPADQTRAMLNSRASGGGGNNAASGGSMVSVEVFDQRSGGEPIDVQTQMGALGPIVRIIARDEAQKAVSGYTKGGGLTNQLRADYNLRQPAVNRG